MKRLLAFAALAIAALPNGAHAIDCARASSPIDYAICRDPKLVRADAAMNRAYAAILKAAPDPEIRAMLVTSQKRWIAARDKTFGRPDDGKPGRFVLLATEDRTTQLTGRMKDGSGQAYLIGEALKQRRFAAGFTGGPFSGYETSCEFFPPENPDGSLNYQCYATRFLQNKDRVCSQGLDWATYRTYASRSEADIVDGKPKLVATCNDSDSCFDDDDPPSTKAGWTLHPDAKNPVTYDRSLPQLDAEAMISMMDDEPSWLKACLTDEHSPPSQKPAE